MCTQLLTQDAAASALLAYAFSGGIGSPEGKGVSYALIGTSPTTFTWSAALEDFDGPPKPIDRYRVEIDRQSKQVLPPQPIVLQDSEIAKAIMAATGQRFASATRFTDGALSISYKVTVQDDPGIAYVVQLRHHGRVASMDSLMTYVAKSIDARILPVPPVYPIPGELERQEATGMGRQITQFVPGNMANSVYPTLPFEARFILVRKIALAMQACWRIPLPEPRLIGELIWNEDSGPQVEPDRHHSLGGPFSSVRKYLQAHIRHSFSALGKQQGIEEYKTRFRDRIKGFIDRHLDDIPSVVEGIPIVAMHSDMGLHNIILSSETPTEIRAVIDWEFVSSAPYACLHPMIERLFRKPAANFHGDELDRAEDLRNAFWDAIPEYQEWNASTATKEFLKWYMFGGLMKPEAPLDEVSKADKDVFWQENIRVVESMLQSSGC
ncbi:MAG: hypothetical protein L6R41_002048 [Letrouitia leprolyta]|nr:MAG: hypothetical protein L6R41_002048 [Letrouitia leprolyta]